MAAGHRARAVRGRQPRVRRVALRAGAREVPRSDPALGPSGDPLQHGGLPDQPRPAGRGPRQPREEPGVWRRSAGQRGACAGADVSQAARCPARTRRDHLPCARRGGHSRRPVSVHRAGHRGARAAARRAPGGRDQARTADSVEHAHAGRGQAGALRDPAYAPGARSDRPALEALEVRGGRRRCARRCRRRVLPRGARQVPGGRSRLCLPLSVRLQPGDGRQDRESSRGARHRTDPAVGGVHRARPRGGRGDHRRDRRARRSAAPAHRTDPDTGGPGGSRRRAGRARRGILMDRLARLAVCAALLAGGCLGPALNDCGDGFLCPADLRCAIGNGEATVCVPPKCGNGQIDLGEACDDGNNISGDGCPADCRPACGDGILDPGEACDEGPSNGIGNCAADCRSARVCGNGVTDAREACDDHNRQSHDGCSSQCTLETFGWTASEIGTPAAGPAVMGYDPPHGVVVLVDAEHRTWTWNGSWQRRHSPMIPRASPDQAAMFYYRLTQRLTLLGDLSASRYDAAVWDGAGWGAGDGGGGPPLSSYGVAYDAAREFPVVLGRSVATGEEQTWELGASWRRVLTARLERNGVPAAPSPGHAMTYDPRRGVVVLYRADGLWIYNGTDWSLQLGSAGPSSDDLLIAYDTVRDRIVLYGAFGSGAARVAQTWAWDGAQWQRKPDGPPARTQPAMTYDLLRGKVLLFGGLDAATGAPLDDTWAWDGLAWQQQDAPVPSLRSHHAAAYDARRASMVMFGGLDFRGNPLGETWIWDGARWNPMAPAVSPPPRADHAMAYDPGTDRTVLFGGTDAAGHSLGDT